VGLETDTELNVSSCFLAYCRLTLICFWSDLKELQRQKLSVQLDLESGTICRQTSGSQVYLSYSRFRKPLEMGFYLVIGTKAQCSVNLPPLTVL